MRALIVAVGLAAGCLAMAGCHDSGGATASKSHSATPRPSKTATPTPTHAPYQTDAGKAKEVTELTVGQCVQTYDTDTRGETYRGNGIVRLAFADGHLDYRIYRNGTIERIAATGGAGRKEAGHCAKSRLRSIPPGIGGGGGTSQSNAPNPASTPDAVKAGACKPHDWDCIKRWSAGHKKPCPPGQVPVGTQGACAPKN